MTMLADRVLPLSGVHNFRDYGGYGVEGGGRLRDGSLWRSAQHAEADADDLAAIAALGIEPISDLRGADEHDAHPCLRRRNSAGRVPFGARTSAGLPHHLQAPGSANNVVAAGGRLNHTHAH